MGRYPKLPTVLPELRWLEDPREILQALAPPPPRSADPRLQPLRLRHAWRLSRAKAILNKWIEPGEPLSTLHYHADINDEEDPETYWHSLPTTTRPFLYPNAASLQTEIDISRPLAPIIIPPGQFATDSELRGALTRQAILPTPDQQWFQDYKERWVISTNLIAERLKLRDATKIEDPNTISPRLLIDHNSPTQALNELLDLAVTDAWPSPEEIETFESDITDFAMSLLIQRGKTHSEQFFLTCFRFTRPETTTLIGFARARARDLTVGDIEEKRAIMELVLEDLAQRCKQAHDLRAELGTYKTLAVVQGIARADIEDDGDIFARIAKKSVAQIVDTTASPVANDDN